MTEPSPVGPERAGRPSCPVMIRGVTTVHDDWYQLRGVDFEYRRPGGTHVLLRRYVCSRGDRAAVLLYSRTRGTVLLTRQFRLPALMAGNSEGMVVEAAGGLLDGQSAAEAARREAEEETGYLVHGLRRAFVTLLDPALVSEHVHLFVAELDGAERVGPGGGLDTEDEDIQTVELALDEALSMVARQEIVDAKTVLLLYHVRFVCMADRGS